MTANQYYALAITIDQRKREEAIDRVPLNINRAGKYYKKLVQQIYAHQPRQRT